MYAAVQRYPWGGMLHVNLSHNLDHLLPGRVPGWRLTFLPLVEPCPAHAHQVAKVLDGVVPGQQVHYFKLFGFKRTYSRSPSAFV